MFSLSRIDHIVIITADLEKCVRFYTEKLGMKHSVNANRQHALHFGNNKINLHSFPHEFHPSSKTPEYGAADFCLITEDDINDVKAHLVQNGVEIIEGVVEREGAMGKMDSVYFYDPDGNLVEIARYR